MSQEAGRPSVSLEFLLYALVALLALWLRLTQLGSYPLTDREAELALSAARTPGYLSDSPAHRSFTTLAFALGGETEAAARWGPALAGVALVLTPALLRRQIGRGPAFLGATLFAISPVLWTAARTGDGTALAALGITAAVFMFFGGSLEWSAAFLGLALVSGPVALTGLTSVVAGFGIFEILRRRWPAELKLPMPRSASWLRALAIMGLVALLLGTGGGFATDSLPGLFDGLGSWVSGWFIGGGVAFVTMLAMLVAYEPLIAFAGGLGVFSRIREGNAVETFLASWVLGALLVLFFYRGRQPADLIWIVLPLSLSAAVAIGAMLNRILQPENVWIALGFTGAIVALFAFAYLQLRAGVSGPEVFQSLLGLPTHYAAAFMGLGLAILAVILLAVGWSREIALPIAGGAAILVLLGISISAGATLNLGDPSARELYRPQASTSGLGSLRESLQVLSRAQTGQPDALPIQVREQPTPALAWAIREYPNHESTDNPAVVITREGDALPGEYLGQSVTIGEDWGWTGWLPPDFLRWLVIRDSPTLADRWVLLVRKDVAGIEEVIPVEFQS